MKTMTEPQANPPEATPPVTGAVGRGYRSDQGRLARLFALWGIALLVLFGCSFLHDVLVGNFEWSRNSVFTIPFVGFSPSPAFLISSGLFVVAAIINFRYQQRQKVADLLIDTESELRKVTWPSLSEVINSSIVVAVCVVLIGFYLAFADWFLNRLMRYLIFGDVGA